MIRLATVFSGIGAIEHALQRMNIDHQLVFACDNGDVEILTKDIGMDLDEIGKELGELNQIINKIQFNDELEDLYKGQLAGMLEEALGEYKKVLEKITVLNCDENLMIRDTLKQIIDMTGVKLARVKEYKKFLAAIGCGSKEQAKLKEFQIILEIVNDYKKDNALSELGLDKDFESADGIEWRFVGKSEVTL